MRYLVFLRGVPGSGKSTFVRENKLEPYTISSDTVRTLLKPPVLSITGRTTISQKINQRVWGLIYSLIRSRMEEGEFTILDATNAGNADIAKYRKLVRTYRYRVLCVDFSDVPIEVAKERNRRRPAYEIVPDNVIEEMHFIIHTQTVPSFVTVVKPHELSEKLQYKVTDFSYYRRIHHLGDIRGNYTALKKYLAFGLNDSDLYVFVGDYTGSGTEDAEIIKFIISIMHRDNVILLEGDREKYLCNLTEDKEQTRISEFKNSFYSLPETEQAGVTKKCILELYKRTIPCIYYKFHDKYILVTHGGLSNLPENLTFVGTEQMINGVGEPEDALIIAESFNNNTGEDTYQIHGHRNPQNIPIKNGRTFNLCDETENRKALRVLTLDKGGFDSFEIKRI